MPASDGKEMKVIQLKMDTNEFIQKWVEALKAAKRDDRPLGLEIMSRMMAKHFSEDEKNAPYLKHHGLDALNGDDEKFMTKVVAKARSINASLKRDTGKTLPMPTKLNKSSRAFTAAYLVDQIDGASDFLK